MAMTQLGNENRRARAVNPASCGSLVTRKIVQTSPHESRTVANARQLAKHFSGEHHRNYYRKKKHCRSSFSAKSRKPGYLLPSFFLFEFLTVVSLMISRSVEQQSRSIAYRVVNLWKYECS